MLLIIEARKPAANREPVWHFAVARFTDLNLRVRHKGKVVFTAPFIPHDLPRQDPKHRYRLISDRMLPPVEDPVRPATRVSPNVICAGWGEPMNRSHLRSRLWVLAPAAGMLATLAVWPPGGPASGRSSCAEGCSVVGRPNQAGADRLWSAWRR